MKLFLVLAAAMLVSAGCGPQPVARESDLKETIERISQEELANLVAEPAGLLEQGDLAAAEALLEKLVTDSSNRHGPNGVEIADLHMGFGLAAFALADEGQNVAMSDLALKHFRQSIDGYALTFGPNDPEVMLAMTTLADALSGLKGDESLPEQIPIFRKVLAAREARLGPTHIETMASLGDLGKALVDDPAAEPSQLEEAIGLMVEASHRVGSHVMDAGDVSRGYFGLIKARAELRLGRLASSTATARTAIATIEDEGNNCIRTSGQAKKLVDALRATGHGAEADELDSAFLTRCSSEPDLVQQLKALTQ